MHQHSYEAAATSSLLSKLPLPEARDLLSNLKQLEANILRKLKSQ